MKKCIICLKEIDDTDEKFCYSCTEFFKWKYKADFKKILRQYEKYYLKNKFSGGKNGVI